MWLAGRGWIHKNRDSRGFTLLELLVVLVIIGIMSTYAGVRMFGTMSRMSSLSAAKKISASLRYARSQAATQGKTFRVSFDFENNRMAISAGKQAAAEDEDEPDSTGNNGQSGFDPILGKGIYELPGSVRFEKIVSFLDDEEYESETFVLTFFPSGASSGAHIFIIDEKERRFRIEVDFVTGAVELAQVEDE